ncbi:hypothetical protein PCYB_003260 [Plasmodium cynomolgi strain B]|uniref:Uncharacterized protein n=1 Tax=Plasmodium cynomolgi (strain B) TaxID=1120755 RepID=K6VJJ5_PLACD|nr:hypothetical protein PCYB_003260 [Plasmodium cynomolgi strain B]GAB69577.1 hypothetical protein PCYB_003260 [Plasmodium cynomolgi strain B]
MSSRGGKRKAWTFLDEFIFGSLIQSIGGEKNVKEQIKIIFGDFASVVKNGLKGNNNIRESFRNNCEEHITKNGSANKLDEYREVCVLLMEALYEIYKYKFGHTENKSDIKEWMRCKIIRTWLSYFIKIYCIPTSIAKAIYSAMQATMRWKNGGYNMCTEILNKVETNKTVSIMEEIRNIVETNLKEISTSEIGTWKSENWCEQKKELEDAFKELTKKYPGTSTTKKETGKKNDDFFDDVDEYANDAKMESGISKIREEIKKQKDAEEKAKAAQAPKPAATVTPAPVEKSPAKTGKIRTEMKQTPRKCANSGEADGRTRMKRSGFRFSGIGFKGSQVSNFRVRGFRTPGFPYSVTKGFPGCRTQESLNLQPEDSGVPNPRVPGFRTCEFLRFSFGNSKIPDQGDP